jgi:predicted XRE-type DNA-binding protein
MVNDVGRLNQEIKIALDQYIKTNDVSHMDKVLELTKERAKSLKARDFETFYADKVVRLDKGTNTTEKKKGR